VTILTGIGGVVAGRFWMTKKEQRDVAQKNYENSMKIEEAYEGAYNGYVAAAGAYIAATPPTQEAFTSLCVAGDNLLLIQDSSIPAFTKTRGWLKFVRLGTGSCLRIMSD
jgi:hypothetical protein